MDEKAQFVSAPAAARSFGFFVDGEWKDGAEHFERASPGHGTPVSRTVRCTVDDLNSAVAAAPTDASQAGSPSATPHSDQEADAEDDPWVHQAGAF